MVCSDYVHIYVPTWLTPLLWFTTTVTPVPRTNYSGKTKWLRGIVSTVEGPLTYRITLESGKIVRRHMDQVIVQADQDVKPRSKDTDPDAFIVFPSTDVPDIFPEPTPRIESSTPETSSRYPQRTRSVTQRYGYSYTH